MNQSTLTWVTEILQLALPIVAAGVGGNVGADINIAASLIAIAQKANSAYQAQVGQPIDPDLIQPIEPIP